MRRQGKEAGIDTYFQNSWKPFCGLAAATTCRRSKPRMGIFPLCTRSCRSVPSMTTLRSHRLFAAGFACIYLSGDDWIPC